MPPTSPIVISFDNEEALSLAFISSKPRNEASPMKMGAPASRGWVTQIGSSSYENDGCDLSSFLSKGVPLLMPSCSFGSETSSDNSDEENPVWHPSTYLPQPPPVQRLTPERSSSYPPPIHEMSRLLDVIPDDLHPIILSFSSAHTLCRSSLVSKQWHTIANADSIWRTQCKSVFGVVPQELKPCPDPCKVLYILEYRKLRQVAREVIYGPGWGGGGGGL